MVIVLLEEFFIVQMCIIMKCWREKCNFIGNHFVIGSIGYSRIKGVKIKIIPIKRVFKKRKEYGNGSRGSTFLNLLVSNSMKWKKKHLWKIRVFEPFSFLFVFYTNTMILFIRMCLVDWFLFIFWYLNNFMNVLYDLQHFLIILLFI